MSIVIEADPVEPIDVKLVGKDYKVTPPKAALALRMAITGKTSEDDPEQMNALIETWIMKAFGKKDGAAVLKRMEDEDDALDLPHIMQLIEKVFEATGNPTT